MMGSIEVIIVKNYPDKKRGVFNGITKFSLAMVVCFVCERSVFKTFFQMWNVGGSQNMSVGCASGVSLRLGKFALRTSSLGMALK